MHHFVARRSKFAGLSLALAGLVAATPLRAQAPAAPERAVAPTSTTATAAPLARGLDAIRTDQILPDVFFIASDEMGGRDTPSNGQRIAARFIRDRLQRLGWKPGAPENDWFYKYPLIQRRVAEPATRIVVSAGEEQLELAFGNDYVFPPNELGNAIRTGGVVCCGQGTAVEFEQSVVEGKWALIFDTKESDENLAKRATAAKAIGILRVPTAGAKPANVDQRLAAWTNYLRRGGIQYPNDGQEKAAPAAPAAAAKPPAPEPLAHLILTADARDRLFTFASIDALKPGEDLMLTLTDTRALVGDGRITCEDVCGFWPGSDPELSKEVIICSAHYDHVGIRADGAVFNGADDNGSGTCGLLALAEALVAYGPMRRSVMLIWVSGEEKGLFGSRAWSDHPYYPNGGKAIADINMDMIGRNAPNQMLITPTKAHPAYNRLTQLAESFFPEEGFTDIKSADDYYMRSDHAMFARIGIPITFLFDDVHADYHEVTDDPEKIDGDKMRRVVRVFLRMLHALQEDKLELTFPPPAAGGAAGAKKG